MDTAETVHYDCYIYSPGYCEYSVSGRKQSNVFTRVECDYSKTSVYMVFGQ